MRIVSVVGTRPQLIKAAALAPVLRRDHDEVFVDTGQHWDEAMAGAFFRELDLPRPDHALGVGGGTHGEQTARMLERLEPILVAERPDAVLVYGDTNSTLAGALAAAKLGIPVAHVEAGLRSFDRRMPEELNRVIADHLSTWLFAPTPAAVDNLAAEGIRDGVDLVGDLMQDLAARVAAEVRDPSALAGIAASAASSRSRLAAMSSRPSTGPRTASRTRCVPGRRSWPRPRRTAPGRAGAPSRDRGRAGERGDPPRRRGPRRGAAGLPHDAGAAAPCRSGPHRLRRGPARGRLAADALPHPA